MFSNLIIAAEIKYFDTDSQEISESKWNEIKRKRESSLQKKPEIPKENPHPIQESPPPRPTPVVEPLPPHTIYRQISPPATYRQISPHATYKQNNLWQPAPFSARQNIVKVKPQIDIYEIIGLSIALIGILLVMLTVSERQKKLPFNYATFTKIQKVLTYILLILIVIWYMHSVSVDDANFKRTDPEGYEKSLNESAKDELNFGF